MKVIVLAEASGYRLYLITENLYGECLMNLSEQR